MYDRDEARDKIQTELALMTPEAREHALKIADDLMKFIDNINDDNINDSDDPRMNSQQVHHIVEMVNTLGISDENKRVGFEALKRDVLRNIKHNKCDDPEECEAIIDRAIANIGNLN
jgi:hypothetical protein